MPYAPAKGVKIVRFVTLTRLRVPERDISIVYYIYLSKFYSINKHTTWLFCDISILYDVSIM